jgi:apolipoprotein N-acyltransferase
MVRAAQTGISAVFDATGRETARLTLGATGQISASLQGALPPTLFAKGGLWIPGVLVLLCGACALGVRRRGIARAMDESDDKSRNKR